MLSNKDLHAEIGSIDEQIEKLDNPYEKASLKASTLMLKLLHNIRSNQVTIMKNSGVSLIESKHQDNDEKVTEE